MVLRFSLGMVRSVPVELAFPFPSPQSPYIYPTISRPEFLSTFLNPLRIFSSSRLPLPICSCSPSYVGGFCVFSLRKRSTSATPWRHSREENPGEDPPPFPPHFNWLLSIPGLAWCVAAVLLLLLLLCCVVAPGSFCHGFFALSTTARIVHAEIFASTRVRRHPADDTRKPGTLTRIHRQRPVSHLQWSSLVLPESGGPVTVHAGQHPSPDGAIPVLRLPLPSPDAQAPAGFLPAEEPRRHQPAVLLARLPPVPQQAGP